MSREELARMMLEEQAMLEALQMRKGPKRRGPDSTLSVAPGTTAEEAADIPEGMIFDPRTGGYKDVSAQVERDGNAGGFAANYLAGTPFIGESMDEAMGATDAFITGRNPELAQEEFRQQAKQYLERRPGMATAANLSGGIVGSLPFAVKGVQAVSRLPGLAQRALAGGIAGGMGGAIEGAFQGYGRGENPDQRAEEAISGGKIGGVFGATLATAAPIAGDAVKAAWMRFKGSDVRAIASALGVDIPAARVIKRAISDGDWNAASTALSRSGNEAMLADAGPDMAALLDASSQTGGPALRIAREAVEPRAARQQQALTSAFDSALGVPKGVRTAAREISRSTAPRRKAAYTAAYSQPVDYGTGAFGENVLQTLQKVPEDDIQKAVATANKLMRGREENYRQILLSVGPDGVSFAEMPSLMQLDYLKRGLQSLAEENADKFGRKTDLGLMYSDLARELRDTLKTNIPEYAAALKVGGDKIEMDDALDIGRRLFSKKTSLEDVTELMGTASDEARMAAATGIRNQLEEIMSDVQAVISDGNVNAREAVAAVKTLSSRKNRDKLISAVGRKKAGKLLREIDKASAALELRAMVATNSKTAVRQAIQDEAKAVGLPSSLRDIVGSAGNPLNSMEKVTQILMSVDGDAKAAANRQMFAQISDALTSITGPDARRALAIVKRASLGQPVKEEQAKFVAGLLVGTPSLSGYQYATQ